MQQKTVRSTSPESMHSYFLIYFPSQNFSHSSYLHYTEGKSNTHPAEVTRVLYEQTEHPNLDHTWRTGKNPPAEPHNSSPAQGQTAPGRFKPPDSSNMSLLPLQHSQADYIRNKRTPQNKLSCNSSHHHWWTNQAISENFPVHLAFCKISSPYGARTIQMDNQGYWFHND